MIGVFGSLLGLAILLAAFAAMPVVAKLIVGPVNRAAGALDAPTRFQLSDFVWLLLLLQIALASLVQFVGADMGGLFGILLAFLVFAVVAAWGGAISFLSRAGVTDAVRRAVFTVLVLPGTLMIMIGSPIVIGMILTISFDYLHRIELGDTQFATRRLIRLISLGVLLLVAVPASGWILRKLSLWVVAQAKSLDANEHALSFAESERQEKGESIQ